MLAPLLSALALAAPFGEAPLFPLGGDYSCARATGAPGEVAVESRTGARFLEATREGFKVRGDVRLGESPTCPEASVRANGAGVAATQLIGGVGTALVAAVRDPGGTWSDPVTLAAEEDWDVYDVETAVADSGDAIVAWTERNALKGEYRFHVARRAPGQSFGRAETIGRTQTQEGLLFAGVAATGEAFLMTATVESSRLPLRVPVRIAIAPRGGAFPAFTGLGMADWRSLPALAVAQDGRALAAIPDGSSLLVAERAPGEGFGAPRAIAAPVDAVGVRARAALGANGEAAVAWIGTEEEEIGITTRRALGAFTAPVIVSPRVTYTGDPFFISQTLERALDLGTPISGRLAEMVAVTGDGHAVLTWGPDNDVNGVYQQRAAMTTIPLGGDRAQTRTAGGVLGLSSGASAVMLADGSPALVWSERIGESMTVHLAADGATPPPLTPAPKVRVGAPASRIVDPGGKLVLPVSCTGPCDIRAQVLGGSRANGRLRLTRAGRGKLAIDQGSVPIAPPRLGPVRIRLTYGSVNTQHPQIRTITLRLVRPPDHTRPPRVVGLRAERRDNTVRVTWQVQRPQDFEAFFVTGDDTREWSGEPLAFELAYSTRGRRSFSATLGDAAAVRWVTLRDGGHARITVPVR